MEKTHERGSSTPIYAARDLEVELGGKKVVGPLDVEIAAGAFLGILGPNGSGKTTLLKALIGSVPPSAGSIHLEGRPLRDYRPTEMARRVGVVPQEFTLDFSFTVGEMVGMGRYAYGEAAADSDAVAAALEATGLTELSGRMVTQLSGGERQRALIAQTLAQQTPTLLLDEPLNNLDLNHQLEIMQLLSSLHSEGKTIAIVLHDLNMAAQYCDDLLLLDRGRQAARGPANAVLDPATIMEVFRVRVAVHRQGRRPYITPLWSQARESAAAVGRPRVHVIAGGGAASDLLEELVLEGFAPTVGVVSVLDTDYTTAQRYELGVVSAAPFQAFSPDVLAENAAFIDSAEAIVVAPVFFGPGNTEPLNAVLQAVRRGKRVVVVDHDSTPERDLTDEKTATALLDQIVAEGALAAATAVEAVERLRQR